MILVDGGPVNSCVVPFAREPCSTPTPTRTITTIMTTIMITMTTVILTVTATPPTNAV
jgi:hypothetical protein